MVKMNLNKIAKRAKENNYTITHDEAIDIFQIIPTACSATQTTEGFIIDGLGFFKYSDGERKWY